MTKEMFVCTVGAGSEKEKKCTILKSKNTICGILRTCKLEVLLAG